MGLGVREGVMATGLSKFMPISSAVLAAIFARVTFILSELIFIVISFILVKLKNKTILKIENFILNNKIEVFLVLSVIVYILYFTIVSFLRFDNFYTGRFDLGNMDQTVWNTSLGRIFQMTDPDGTNIISRLSFHADFILILFAPFYWFLPDPRLLLFTQTFIVGFGAFFVFLLAKDVLKNKSISFVLAISYLLNPALEYANLYDFHAVTLATTFLLGAFYFLRLKKYILFILFAILSALTKENVWLTVSFFGIYIIMQTFYSFFKTKTRAMQITKRQIFGILIFITSIAIFCYLVFNIIPLNRGGDHFAFNYYSDFGNSPSDILKNAVFTPQKTLGLLIQKERLDYLLQIFSPVGFLPILSLSTLFFAFPDLMINLLSNNSQLHQIYFQYTSIITPFLFIATIFAVRNIKRVIPSIPNWMFIAYLALFAIYSAHALGPLPGAKNPNLDMIVKPRQNKEVINSVLSRIEEKDTVAATNNLGSHLSRRQEIFTIPIGMDKAEVLAFLLNDPFAQPSPLAQKKMVEDYKKNKAYKIIYEKDDFIVFQKL